MNGIDEVINIKLKVGMNVSTFCFLSYLETFHYLLAIKCPDVSLGLWGLDGGVETELSLGVVESEDPDQPVCLDGGEVGLVCAGGFIAKHRSLSLRSRYGARTSGDWERQSATVLQEQKHGYLGPLLLYFCAPLTSVHHNYLLSYPGYLICSGNLKKKCYRKINFKTF